MITLTLYPYDYTHHTPSEQIAKVLEEWRELELAMNDLPAVAGDR